MIALIDDHREAYGVEPICRALPEAPSTYYKCSAQRQDPTRLLVRAQQDVALKPEMAHVFARSVVRAAFWRHMMGEGFTTARCMVSRLRREMGLLGVLRGKPVRTTISDKAPPCPLDHVNRQFTRHV